ncbi:MAG: hypothetical protein OXH09_05270 [Gammaproteobacteria bacterium]|nr:hypothetical protein [Gammaproteobacteria bacterium]
MASPSSTMPAFDTHKAVKALRHAGFDDVQAEAVVDQINGAITENLVFKADLAETERSLAGRIGACATKDDLAETERSLAARIDATKEDLAETERKLAARIAACATKEDLLNYATKEDLRAAVAALATKEDLRNYATKEDLENYATKEDLAQLELRMTVKMEALTGKMLRDMGGGLALVVALIKGLDLLVG